MVIQREKFLDFLRTGREEGFSMNEGKATLALDDRIIWINEKFLPEK